MARSIKLMTMIFAVTICYLTPSQAAPLDTPNTTTSNSRATPTSWMKDVYNCWNTNDTETCNRMMMGDRSSHDLTTPAADVVEMFLSTTVQEDPLTAITQTGTADSSSHFIEFTFNVSATSGVIQRTEVRVYHSAVASVEGCDTTNGVLLKLLAVNDQNQASMIDNVTVHIDQDQDGWVIFDSITYDWRVEQDDVHRMAITVSVACSSVELSKLGFAIDNNDQNKLPLLAVFTAQERMTTEVKLLPTAIVNELFEQSARSVEQKRGTNNCHLKHYSVNFRKIGLKNILRPEVLKMNYCTGSCKYPVAHNEKNTIYASLKAQIAKISDKVEDPSCVPISYRKQSIMYISPTGGFFRIVNAELSATSCGCR